MPEPHLRSHRLAALVNACYPAAARCAEEEGCVLVRALVGNDCTIVSWRIQQGSGFSRLDEAVRCFIERLAIEPRRRNGCAVEAEAFLPVRYRLDLNDSGRAGVCYASAASKPMRPGGTLAVETANR